MDEPVAVDIAAVYPEAKRIPRTELAVDDFVFDAWGGWHRLVKVTHYRAHTTAKRDDGQVFVLAGDEDITIFPGGD